MLNPKDAVEKAKEHLLGFYPAMPLTDLRLEELEPFGNNWRVTLSAEPPPLPAMDAGSMARLDCNRAESTRSSR